MKKGSYAWSDFCWWMEDRIADFIDYVQDARLYIGIIIGMILFKILFDLIFF